MAEYAIGAGLPTVAFTVVDGTIRVDNPGVQTPNNLTVAPFQTDSAGNLRTSGAGGKATYWSGFTALVAAATATDLLIINGSATKKVFIQEIRLAAVATAAISIPLLLIKRSTANAGGTSTGGVLVPADSADPAATSTILLYTANPTTLGTVVGNVRSTYYTLGTTGNAAGDREQVFDLRGYNGGKGLKLASAAEGLALNLGGSSPGAGNLFGGSICLHEEPLTA